MRCSIGKRIGAVLLCCCMLLTSGCFPVYSVLGDMQFSYGSEPELKYDDVAVMQQDNQKVSGIYPSGTRAFVFKDCTYESDIDDFRLIAHAGNVFIYYYTGITVKNDGADEYGNTENKKGYYDKKGKTLDYFWTIAAYNFVKKEYTTIHKQSYNPVNDAGKMNCNPVTMYTNTCYCSYMVNVGYFFIEFYIASYTDDTFNFIYTDSYKKVWKLSNDDKEKIRDYLGISNNLFCCSDVAVKNLGTDDGDKFAVSFMRLPDKNNQKNFNQDNVMLELQLKSEVKDERTVLSTKLIKKESKILTINGGNILSSNYTSGNCIYVMSVDKSYKWIKFGIDNRDRRTRFKIELPEGELKTNNVLQSFSVLDWYDDQGNISNEESMLELVFKNRVCYYHISRKSSAPIEYKYELLKEYPLDEFNMNYCSSDDMPSVGYYSHGINLSSTEKGFRCIDTDGSVEWSWKDGAAYFSSPYGERTLIVGFKGYTYTRKVTYLNQKGEVTSTQSSESPFTMAQLPFATVFIV